jgi:two-component system CheB/CheR fusion protein
MKPVVPQFSRKGIMQKDCNKHQILAGFASGQGESDAMEWFRQPLPSYAGYSPVFGWHDGLDPTAFVRLSSLVAALPAIIWESWGAPDATSQRINFISDHVVTMLGYSIEEWLTRPNFWLTIIHPDDRERAVSRSMEIFTSGTPGIVEFRWVSMDGTPIWVEARLRPLYNEAGTPIGMRGITFDIHGHKATEALLERAKEEAERANQAKDHFLAMLSHELRTPLTPVLTIAQVLESDPDLPEDFRPLVKILQRNVELEVRLINDLLDLNRIIHGKLPLKFDTIDTHKLLHDVVEICQSDIQAGGIEILFDLQATRSVIHADPARIEQILWNLLKNAVKFTPSGGSITVRTSNDADMRLRIDFRDTGIGIGEDLLPRIFQAFEQGAPVVTRTFGGLGLGLAISRAIADMHGAMLSADSPGKGLGATFSLTISTVDAPASNAVSGSCSGACGELRPCRILAIDDHEDTGRTNQLLLERRGYQVRLATTVAAAKQWADAEKFDLVICDIGLPDGSGIDVIEHIRHAQPGIRAVALSGFGMDEDIHRSMEAGFHEHLTKPVTFSNLLAVIDRLMLTP